MGYNIFKFDIHMLFDNFSLILKLWSNKRFSQLRNKIYIFPFKI